MAEDRDSLLREVDEELRREQMQKLWERYNGLILGAAALIVLSVGGYKVLQGRRLAATQAAGAEYAAALKLTEANKTDEASKSFDAIAHSGSTGYAALAKLHLAGALAKGGKTAEAISAYQALADDASADSMLKSFAILQVASLRLGDADFTDQQNRLNTLAGEDGVFKTTARELLGLSAFKAGKLDEARKYFEPLLLDPKATRAIQDRVKIVMGEIARAETGKADAAKAGSPAAAPATSPAVPPAAPVTTPASASPEVKTDAKPAEAGKQ